MKKLTALLMALGVGGGAFAHDGYANFLGYSVSQPFSGVDHFLFDVAVLTGIYFSVLAFRAKSVPQFFRATTSFALGAVLVLVGA